VKVRRRPLQLVAVLIDAVPLSGRVAVMDPIDATVFENPAHHENTFAITRMPEPSMKNDDTS